jgi:hypothetical protein
LTVIGGASEALGTNERVNEIDEDAERHERSEHVVESHFVWFLETFAGIGIGDRCREKCESGRNEDQIKHGGIPVGSADIVHSAYRFERASCAA